MADELSIITQNAANNGWVDSVPGAVSSGYQAQNIVMESTLIGCDHSEITETTGLAVNAEPSGPIGVNGMPYMISERVTLTPDANTTTYIRVASGSTWDKGTLETTQNVPTYDHIKRGLYRDNKRYLNWIIYSGGSKSTVFRIAHSGRKRVRIQDFLDINGIKTTFDCRFRAGDIKMYGAADIRTTSSVHRRMYAKGLGRVGGTFRIRFLHQKNDAVGGSLSIRRGFVAGDPPGPRNEEIVRIRNIIDYPRVSSYSGDHTFEPGDNIEIWGDVQALHIGQYTWTRFTDLKISVAELPSNLMLAWMGPMAPPES